MSRTEKKFRILLIESDSPVRAALEDFLRARGFDIASTSSGSSAIRRMREETSPFDVILTDVGLTDTNVLDLLQVARQCSEETQVVTMASYAMLDAAMDASRHGAFDYITKPFKFEQIEILINKMLERKKLVNENQKLSERVQSLYSRLDLLKDNRDKLDRFMRDTSERLDQQADKLDDCLNLIQKVLLQSR